MMKIVKIVYLALVLLGLSGVAQAQGYWGAIYIDRETRIAGGSYDMKNEAEAKRVALSSCNRKHGNRKNNCKLVGGAFADGCMSVYMGDNKRGGYGTHGYSLNDARARALNECRKEGVNCKESLGFCTTIIYQ